MRPALLLLLSCATLLSTAQAPEKIYGKNKRLMPNAYYVEQIGLWHAVVDADPLNADAWYNYYRASRNAYIVGDEAETKDTRGTGRFARLQGIVDGMAAHVPESFEYAHVLWMNSYGDMRNFAYLQRALKMEPLRPEPYLDLVTVYELTGNDSLRDAACAAYLQLGDYSPGLLNYGYNLLAGLAPNAILLTHGDKDTEAVWLLQGARGFRTDVKLLNLDMLLRDEYRNRWFGTLNIEYLPADPLTSDTAFAWYQQHIIQHIAGNAAGRPVEVSLSVEGPYVASIMNALHVTGLGYRYSTAPFDATPELVENYGNRYLLDQLRVPIVPDISLGNVRQFNAHYLPSLTALREHYDRIGQTPLYSKYKALAEQVAADAGLSEASRTRSDR